MEIKKISIGEGSWFVGERFQAGKEFKVGKDTIIRARNFIAGDYVTIGNNNKILAGEKFEIGNCGFIGNNNDFTGISIEMGEYIFLDSNVLIGHGGKMNYSSTIKIGKHCMVCAFVKLNVNYPIEIGDDVGIGEYVDVWTHGSFPPVLQGFPHQFGPVKIGSNVWLPAKSTVMPNITIGDNIVIAANSVIIKNLPSGSLCGGVPAKVIKENMYPQVLDNEKKAALISSAMSEYDRLAAFKGLQPAYTFYATELVLKLANASFDFNTMTVTGELDEQDEDLRDFIRRRGFKFFTGKPFRSIVPPLYQDLLNVKI